MVRSLLSTVRGISPTRRHPWLVAAVLAVSGLTFAADLHLTLGASAAPLYEIAVLLALWASRARYAVGAAGLVSALIVAEAVATAPYPGGSTTFNRLMTLLAVWTTAVLVVLYRRTESALRARQREAQAYLDIAAVAIVAIGPEGRVALVNRKGCEMLGRSAEEVMGRSWLEDFVAPDDRQEAGETVQRLLAGDVDSGVYFELPIVTASGEQRSVAWRSAVMREEDGALRGFLMSGEDVTDRRRAEEKLRTQQALARVGQMAAVVAHEVRNPLAGIRSAIQVLSGRLPAGESERKAVLAVLERLDGLKEMTDELLLFARPRVPRRVPVSLRSVLDDAALLVGRGRDHVGVKVEIEIQGGDVVVLADGRSLKSAFFNLFLNAAQAMGRGGVIRVSCVLTDGLVRVTVADQGAGIRPEWRERIFEPFFTTRHRGTGLGLAIVKRDIELHEGSIEVICPPGGGTEVVVCLPLPPAATPLEPADR